MKKATFKRLLMGSAAITLIAQFGAAPAHAADPTAIVNTGATPGVLVNAGSASPAQQDALAPIASNADANTIVVTVLAGGGSGLFTNSSQAIAASATGNALSLSGSLTSLASPDGLVFGTLQTTSGIIRSVSQGNLIGININDFQSGSLTASTNSIRSTTTLNSSSILTSGLQAQGYINTATQNATALVIGGVSDRTVQSSATVAMTSFQSSNIDPNISGQDAAAIVGGTGSSANKLFLNAGSQTNNALSASLSLSTNTLAATFTGNLLSANPRISAVDGAAEGTIAIAQSQSYDGNISTEQATNTGSTLTISVEGANDATNALANGSASLSSNAVSALATGNSVSNPIAFGAGQSFNGTTATNRATIELGSATKAAEVSSEIASAVVQYVGTSPASTPVIGSKTVDAYLAISMQSLSGSQIATASNTISAATTGNILDSSIRTSGTVTTFDGSMALGANQIIDAASISATISNGAISTSVGNSATAVADSTVRIATNTAQARAYGQQATQVIAVTAANVPLLERTAILKTDGLLTGTDLAVSAEGAAIVGTYQSNLRPTAVSANLLNGLVSLVSLDPAGNRGSSLAVTGNVQNSTAVAEIATSTATVTGTASGYSVGVVNAQRLAGSGSTVSAMTTATETLQALQIGAAGNGFSTTADLTSNRNEAVAAGLSATNTVSLSSQKIALASQNAVASGLTYDAVAPGTLAFNGGSSGPAVEAAVALLNDQAADGIITSVGSAQIKLDVAGIVAGSSLVRNNSNTLTLQAQAAVAANALTLTAPVIASAAGSVAPVASLSNVQAMGTNAVSSASMLENDEVELLTRIVGRVLNSTVAQSGNNLAALADGNRAGNTLTVNANTVLAAEGGLVGASAGRTSYVNGAALNDVAFALLNAQSTGALGGSSSIAATLRDQLDDSVNDGAQMVTSIGGDIDSSSVSATTNVLRALANGNFAGSSTAVGNSLTINAPVAQTSAAVQNVQIANSDVTALLGFSGTNVLSPNNASSTNAPLSLSGNTLTVLQRVEFAFAYPLSDREAALLNSYGWSAAPGDASVTVQPGQYNVAGLNLALDPGTVASGDEKIRIVGFQALSGSVNDGGVFISLGAASQITNSALAVTGNSVNGSSFANTASSALSLNAATIVADGTQRGATVTSRAGGVEALADYSVVNSQQVGMDVATRSVVANTFGITSGANTSISNSTITVSTNTQTSVATASYASNALTLNGATTDAGGGAPGAVGSTQSNAAGSVTLASSAMDITAPMAGNGTIVAVSGNRNASAATINDVRNTLNASGISLGGTGSKAQAVTSVIDTVVGDYVLSNIQRAVAQSSVTSLASTQIYNQDFANPGADIASNGSIAISNNATAADAIANRASNTLAITATGQLGANAALLNEQSNGSNVSATATSAILLGLHSGTGAKVENAVVTSASNSTVATAAGNTATNNLRLAGASIAASQIAGIGTSTSLEGQAVILNAQSNTGNISAESVGAVLNVLPGTGLSGAINNAAIAVTGTTIAANAVGNTTDSTVTLNLQNSDNPAAVISAVQMNTGAVSARVTNAQLAVSAAGVPNSGNWQMSGSSITATAVGNSATLTIIAQ